MHELVDSLINTALAVKQVSKNFQFFFILQHIETRNGLK